MTTQTAPPERPAALDPRDALALDALLSPEELALRERVRRYVDEQFSPRVADLFEEARFPRELAKELGELGVLGMHLHGYGCPGASAVEYGLACLELEAGDTGLRTFASVQGSLAMTAIHTWGSEEQKRSWLPAMAAGDAIGCFALTEPAAGSDPASMQTTARRVGSDWVLNGRKRWIGLASIADIAGRSARPWRTGCTRFPRAGAAGADLAARRLQRGDPTTASIASGFPHPLPGRRRS